MQVRELVDLAGFLKTFIQDRQLPQQYKQLIGAVSQAAQNQAPENVQARFTELLRIHREADKQILSPARELAKSQQFWQRG